MFLKYFWFVVGGIFLALTVLAFFLADSTVTLFFGITGLICILFGFLFRRMM